MIVTKVTDDSGVERMKAFLAENKLPSTDLSLEGNYLVMYFDDDARLIGTGALEFYSSYALLRSIAISEKMRGKALGKKVVSDLIKEAERHDLKQIFLLTETAPMFFEKTGFRKMNRNDVPEPVKASTEFASVCPMSAVCMSFTLAREHERM